MTFWTLSKDLA